MTQPPPTDEPGGPDQGQPERPTPRPLQHIALGLTFALITAKYRGSFDLVPDPVGWAFVLIGLHQFGGAWLERRAPLRVAALLALAASAATYPPSVHDRLVDADPSITWAVNLPQVIFCLVLAHTMWAFVPRAEPWVRGTVGTLVTAFVIVAVGPVIVYGADQDQLEDPLLVAATWTLLALVATLFTVAGRPWAGPQHIVALPEVEPSEPETT